MLTESTLWYVPKLRIWTCPGLIANDVYRQVNLDLPRDPATYLHRIGRSGRFGTKGLAVTLLSHAEVHGICLLGQVFKMEISELPSPVPSTIYTHAATDRDGNGHESAQIVAQTPPADKNRIEVIVSHIDIEEADRNVKRNAVQDRYEKEEKVYEKWVKLL